MLREEEKRVLKHKVAGLAKMILKQENPDRRSIDEDASEEFMRRIMMFEV